MKSKYKTFWWLISSFSILSIIKVMYYQFLKTIHMLNYYKTFRVTFKHEGETMRFILRYNGDDFAILRGTFMSKVYDMNIGEVKTIIDAGSHIGCVAIYYAKKYPGAKILCFEPDHESYMNSMINAYFNKVDLDIWNCGISDKTGVVKFNKNVRNPSYSLVDENGTETIAVTSLDEVIADKELEQIDILKLDIEGHEPQAFVGMANSKDKIKHILLENHSAYYSLEKIKEVIEENGYNILPELPIWEELYGEKNAMFLLKK